MVSCEIIYNYQLLIKVTVVQLTFKAIRNKYVIRCTSQITELSITETLTPVVQYLLIKWYSYFNVPSLFFLAS